MNQWEKAQAWQKKNNWVKKINEGNKLNGCFPAIERIQPNENMTAYFLAVKHYPVLLNDALRAKISYDIGYKKQQREYKDEFGRVIRVTKTEKAALKFATA